MRHLVILITFFLGSLSFIHAQLDNSDLLTNAREIVESEGVLEILNETEARYTERKRITILNKDSRANAFVVHYDPDNKILALDADIYDLSGKAIRKVRKSEIRDVAAVDGYSIYNDSRVKYIELNHSEYPYVLEFSFSQRIKGINLASMPNWYFQDNNSSAITSSTYSVTVPEGMDIQYQLYNIELQEDISEKSGSKTYTWTARNLPAINFEPFDPPYHRQIPMLRITPSNFKIDEYSGSMESWNQYGDFLHQLWSGRDQVSADLSEKVKLLTEGAPDNKEKIARLYRFMQENKRYVSVQLGIGGWQPFTANYVEEHGYGDCKALSNYMKAILQEVGIESYPVIIKAGGHHPYEVEDDFVDPAFNHAILYVPEEDVWLECTSSTNPPGYLGKFANDRKVLLVTPEGGKLARTPKLGTAENRSSESADIRLNANGSASLSYQAEMHGILHEDWRYYSYAYTKEEIENKVREKGKLPNMTLGAVTISNDSYRPSSNILFEATANRYASRAGKRLFVPLNLICPYNNVPEAVEDRQYPVVIPFGYTQELTVNYQIPEGFRVESLPDSQQLDTPFGKYEFHLEEVEGQVKFHRKLALSDEEQAADQYEVFRDFLLQVAKYDESKMVLVSE